MADRFGLRRIALDLHIHTPASEDWKGPSASPEEIADAVLAAGLDGFAVTDHQSGEAIDAIRAAAASRGLIMFPGVELNNLAGSDGVHMIVLFETDTSSADVEGFLSSISALRGTGARKTRGAPLAGPLQVLDKVREYGGIAILAHCQSSKGALAEMRGDLRTRVVRHRAVLAAEAHDFHDAAKQESRTRTYDYLDGSDTNYKKELAVYEASDNPSGSGGHGLKGIGTRFSYFYVDERIGLESLRQCFVDRDTRIEIPIPGETPRPFISAPVGVPHIHRLEVTGGFLDGFDVTLHPAMTTVVGAKGSGKSLLVELLRFVLDQEPTQKDLSQDHETKLRNRLQLYGRVKVTVYDQSGTEFSFSREYDPANGNPFDGTSVLVSELFPCHFLSQGEIVRIAESEDEQLRFIDSFFDFQSYQREIESSRAVVSEMDRQVAIQIRARKRLAALETDRVTVTAQLDEKDKLLASPVFARYQDAEGKQGAIDRTLATLYALENAVGEAVALVEAVPLPLVPRSLTADPLVKRSVGATEQTKQVVVDGIRKLTDLVQKTRGEIQKDAQSWSPELLAVRSEYVAEIKKSGGDKAAISQQRATLRSQLDRVEADFAKEKQRAEQLTPTVQRRDELLSQLDEKLAQYTAARSERCAWFSEKSGGRIQASVSAGTNVDDYRRRLGELKKGSYLSGVEIDTIAKTVTARQLVRALLRFDLSGKESDLQGLSEVTGMNLGRIRQLAEFLLEGGEYENLLNLQHSAPPVDRPRIALRLQDGSYAPLDELSTGQKCTALLVMALCEGNNPIVIDQPEDSLDIRSVWEDMCLRLRTSKRQRQFVFTSHNSSLAVASDTDKFVVLEADAQKAKVGPVGAIDDVEVRDQVVLLLEGGSETYFRKQRKYNLLDTSRD